MSLRFGHEIRKLHHYDSRYARINELMILHNKPVQIPYGPVLGRAVNSVLSSDHIRKALETHHCLKGTQGFTPLKSPIYLDETAFETVYLDNKERRPVIRYTDHVAHSCTSRI